jgi:hypothetical protein
MFDTFNNIAGGVVAFGFSDVRSPEDQSFVVCKYK